MCAIFGWVLPSARSLDRSVLETLTDSLHHRGPDAGGYWLARSRDDRWQIAFGHRRLSIIDLSPGGAQPMQTDDGCVLIFNGEIYNYVELRDELIGQGVTFKSSSDTEVLLHLLRRQGAAGIGKLRGMFAFAFWDPAEQRLILARDHFGKKPIYLAELADGGLVFASELAALTQFPSVDPGFDWDSLSEYFSYRYVPGPNTFFRAIKKLAPGYLAVWKDGRLERRQYYVSPFGDPGLRPMREADAESCLSEALRRAVSIRLKSDAPFGAFLSGGIDSATIVGMMTREMNRPVKTFSVGFEEAGYSELGHARAVAAHFGADHQEIVVQPNAVMSHLVEAVRHRGAPVSEPADVPILLLSKAASSAVKMVLTGEGSDELLGGYPKHRFDRWIDMYHRAVPDALHRTLVAPLVGVLPYAARRAAVVLRAAGDRALEDRMVTWFGAVGAREREHILLPKLVTRETDRFPFSARGTPLKRMLFFDQTSWLPDNLLERGDRMMMAGSIEGRMPFMDVDLAEVAARIPDHLLIGGKGGKTVLRRAVAALLPPSIIERRKIGFRVPVNIWFRTSFRDYVADHLLGASAATRGFYQPGSVEAVLQAHNQGRHNHEKLIWTMLNLELFARQFRPAM